MRRTSASFYLLLKFQCADNLVHLHVLSILASSCRGRDKVQKACTFLINLEVLLDARSPSGFLACSAGFLRACCYRVLQVCVVLGSSGECCYVRSSSASTGVMELRVSSIIHVTRKIHIKGDGWKVTSSLLKFIEKQFPSHLFSFSCIVCPLYFFLLTFIVSFFPYCWHPFLYFSLLFRLFSRLSLFPLYFLGGLLSSSSSAALPFTSVLPFSCPTTPSSYCPG